MSTTTACAYRWISVWSSPEEASLESLTIAGVRTSAAIRRSVGHASLTCGTSRHLTTKAVSTTIRSGKPGTNHPYWLPTLSLGLMLLSLIVLCSIVSKPRCVLLPSLSSIATTVARACLVNQDTWVALALQLWLIRPCLLLPTIGLQEMSTQIF